jgi:hypothetical protein
MAFAYIKKVEMGSVFKARVRIRIWIRNTAIDVAKPLPQRISWFRLRIRTEETFSAFLFSHYVHNKVFFLLLLLFFSLFFSFYETIN